jgi:hypothetical protein
VKIRLNPNRHRGGFIFADTSSRTSTTQTSAPTTASEGAIAVGQQGRFVEGTDISGRGALAGSRFGTTEVTGGGDVNIETSDPELLGQALERLGQLSSQFSATLGDVAKETNIAQADQLSRILDAFGLLQSRTDKETVQSKFLLWVVLGVLALLAVVFWPRLRLK